LDVTFLEERCYGFETAFDRWSDLKFKSLRRSLSSSEIAVDPIVRKSARAVPRWTFLKNPRKIFRKSIKEIVPLKVKETCELFGGVVIAVERLAANFR
jgi:hypothetical protein